MCFTYDAEPPAVPVALLDKMASGSGGGNGVRGEEVVLTSVDGTPFAAFAGHVDTLTPPKSAVVILPDVRGLFSFYRELALRFAQAGIEAIAIDYFGRTAGLTPRDEEFDFMPHVLQTTPQTVASDVATAVAYLRNQVTTNPQAIFTVGFCFGGRNSFMQAANHLGLAGVIGFYGSLGSGRFPGPTPAELAAQFECPVLGLFGGADQGIPQDQIDAFNQALAAAHVPHEITVFPGAPHSFFDRKQDEFTKESDESWRLMLNFIAKYTPRQ